MEDNLLNELREIAKRSLSFEHAFFGGHTPDKDTQRIAELFVALDKHLTRGGAPPTDWWPSIGSGGEKARLLRDALAASKQAVDRAAQRGGAVDFADAYNILAQAVRAAVRP